MESISEFGGTLFLQYAKGGPAMHPITVLSVLAVALIVFKAIQFRQARTDANTLIVAVRSHVLRGKLDKAIRACEAHRGPVAIALKVGLLHAEDSKDEIERHIEVVAMSSLSRLQRYLGALATISTIAPLLGFFGTVVGMIISFDALAANGMGRPELVANGISIALLTTAYGLLVAFLTQPFYSFFIGRVGAIGEQVEVASHSLLDVLGKRRSLVARDV